jgi:hypothetical protein
LRVWAAREYAGVPPGRGAAGGFVAQAGERAAGAAFEQAGAGQGRQGVVQVADVAKDRGAGAGWSVTCEVVGGDEDAGGAVAQGGVADLADLRWIGEALAEGLDGLVLTVGVAEGEAGELLGAGQARRAVATRRAGLARSG